MNRQGHPYTESDPTPPPARPRWWQGFPWLAGAWIAILVGGAGVALAHEVYTNPVARTVVGIVLSGIASLWSWTTLAEWSKRRGKAIKKWERDNDPPAYSRRVKADRLADSLDGAGRDSWPSVSPAGMFDADDIDPEPGGGNALVRVGSGRPFPRVVEAVEVADEEPERKTTTR